MEALINIQQQGGNNVVSAKELYQYLEVGEKFSDWIKRMISYGFSEGIDYQAVAVFATHPNGVGGTTKKDYALTLDTAKEISMLQRTEKGKVARRYFIECEKRLKEGAKPLSQIEILLQSAQLLVDQEKRLNRVEDKVLEIEAKTATRPNYFTVVGYAVCHKINVNLHLAAKIGRKAAVICRQRNLLTDEIPDPRFGIVKMYPKHVLDEVFSEAS